MARPDSKDNRDRRDRRDRRDQHQEVPEFQERVVFINRVAKVVKGGRILGFAALTVVGDGDGRIGMGKGKSREVPVSVQKAMDQARRAMEKVPLRNGTIFHAVEGHHGASRVMLHPKVPALSPAARCAPFSM